MISTSQHLAHFRVAYCFESDDHGMTYPEHLAHALKAVDESVSWERLDPWHLGLIPVFSGRILDGAFARSRFGHRFVEVLLFGMPTEGSARFAAGRLAEVRLPTSLGVWVDPPMPEDEKLGLPLTEVLTHGTVVVLADTLTEIDHRLARDFGLQIVRAKDWDEENAITMSADDLNQLAHRFVRMFGRNLRPWLNEPRPDDSIERHLAHAQELIWAGAPMLAAVVAGRALERDLRVRVQAGADDGRLHGLMLGKLIATAKEAGKIEPLDASRMQRFKDVRNRCAHAIAEDQSIDVEAEVKDFLSWFSRYHREQEGQTGH